MNPPVSQGPLYDRGYADGYRDRVIDMLVFNLANVDDQARLAVAEILRSQDSEWPKSAS